MEDLKGTTREIRILNRKRIFSLIFQKEQVSRQDITLELSLSLPTVNQNLKELFEEGLIDYVGNFESTGGRKAQIITLCKDAKFAVGLSITQNSIRIVAVDLYGQVMDYEKIGFPFEAKDSYGKRLKEIVEDFVAGHGYNKERMLGVGIAVPGVFNEDFHWVGMAPSLSDKEFSIDTLTKYLDYPLVVDNDANAGVFAEVWNREEMSDVAYLLLEKGVGGALVLNNQIYKGGNGRAGEFGHMTMVANGKMCRCGRKGCLEAYISTSRITDDLNVQIEEFFQGLEDGNAVYEKVWDQYLEDLCIGISNLRIAFDCDVVIGGVITPYIEKYKGRIEEMLKNITPFEEGSEYFKLTKYRSSAPAAGVALQLISEFVEGI